MCGIVGGVWVGRWGYGMVGGGLEWQLRVEDGSWAWEG